MSRAFTKEVDDAPVARVPDRPISSAPNLVTPQGAVLIAQTIEDLDEAIRNATDQAQIDDLARDQRYWAARHAGMQVVPPTENPTEIGFGVTATIRRRGKKMAIRIVGEDEADPAKGLIAWTAPLAKALEGATIGEAVLFEAGGKSETIEILEIGSG